MKITVGIHTLLLCWFLLFSGKYVIFSSKNCSLGNLKEAQVAQSSRKKICFVGQNLCNFSIWMQMIWCLHFMVVHNEFHLACGGCGEYRVEPSSMYKHLYSIVFVKSEQGKDLTSIIADLSLGWNTFEMIFSWKLRDFSQFFQIVVGQSSKLNQQGKVFYLMKLYNNRTTLKLNERIDSMAINFCSFNKKMKKKFVLARDWKNLGEKKEK